MPWARFDERFPTHRRIRKLSDAAFRLHVSAICWGCEYLTDGHVAPTDLPELSEVRQPKKAAEELVQSGRWHTPGHDCDSPKCYPINDGWLIHDFLEYNPSKADVEAKREADAERKRRGRTSVSLRSPNGHTVESVRTADGSQAESERRPSVPARTVPTRPDSPRGDESPTARNLIAEHVEACRLRPPNNVLGQLGKQVAALLAEGIDPEHIRGGLAQFRRKDVSPSLLPSLVNGVMNGPRLAAVEAAPRTVNDKKYG